MGKFENNVRVGLREKESNRLVAVYPRDIQGDDKYVEDKITFWYYQQSCSAETELENLYVDVVSEKEAKAFQ